MSEPAPVPDELVREFQRTRHRARASGLSLFGADRAGLAAVVARLSGPGDTEAPIIAALRKTVADHDYYGDPQGERGPLGARAAFARELLGLAGVVGVPAQPANDEAKPDEPFVACCVHCKCPEGKRDGHDDLCMHGCNDDLWRDLPGGSGTAQDTPEDR